MAKKEKKKKTYDVQVARTGYALKTIKVKATSKKKAEKKALDEAVSLTFSEHDADYTVEGVIKQ